MPNLEIHYDSEDTGGGGEWAALYVDERLDRVGDAYLAEERAFELLGVKIVQDSAFMRGQSHRDGVAKTLDEVAAYREQRNATKTKAAQLRAEAQKLIDQAEALEGGSARARAPKVK